MTKYIFITGGVLSSLGKGVASASIAALLKARGYSVRMRKMDPYLNVDPGAMSPFQHGEVYVTDDGTEADLDLGHYERFTDIKCYKTDTVTSGRIYWDVLTRERAGGYAGRNVQLVPDVSGEVKAFMISDMRGEDFVLFELGGTIGDDEQFIFIEGIRDFTNHVGRENTMFVHLSYVPYLRHVCEVKTKPTQQAVRQMLARGLSPDLILCRCEERLPRATKEKLAMFCDIEPEDVISAPDVASVYEIPLVYHSEGLDERILEHFGIKDAPKPDLHKWKLVVDSKPTRSVTIAMVVKYCGLPDAYKSVIEAVKHAGIANNVEPVIKWINAEEIEASGIGGLIGADAIIVPGGFGARGIEGKISAVKYARENNVPYLGICLGMQMAAIEAARNLLGISDANSTEFTKECTPIIHYMGEFEKDGHVELRHEGDDIGGTLRLGAFPTILTPNSVAARVYGATEISERHRHRYEMDISFAAALAEKGVVISGVSPDGKLPEVLEIPAHKFFVAGQFHPEFKSRPFAPHPLFDALLKAAIS